MNGRIGCVELNQIQEWEASVFIYSFMLFSIYYLNGIIKHLKFVYFTYLAPDVGQIFFQKLR